MNKSMRYLVFACLFAVAGFGVYSLMNKSAVAVDENAAATAEVVDPSAVATEVAQADAPKVEEVVGQEGEVKIDEVKKMVQLLLL
jgi:hypothetical protein